ncbi:MAG: histidinol-phosphatase [Clostridia bacterium]|nr:histidinol-phosphatase [Clostridia bacterium]
MILRDLHIHTTYCDGKNTPEEMVVEAIEKGMDTIGFSGHSYSYFDESYCMSQANTELYIREINALKEKYKGKIEILCGIEQDVFSDNKIEDFDYVIGSVHYLKVGEKYFPIDESKDDFCRTVEEHFGGDFIAAAEQYFAQTELLAKKKIDIIGHFDLITKFNEADNLFDTNDARYIAAAKRAIDTLIPLGIPFEINTGAIFRGYRSEPYPAPLLIDYIKANGGKFVLSSDSHSKKSLCFEFDKWNKLL